MLCTILYSTPPLGFRIEECAMRVSCCCWRRKNLSEGKEGGREVLFLGGGGGLFRVRGICKGYGEG